MLNIAKDESIQSVIFRTHVVNGVGDFSNIITTKGGWAYYPKILEGTLHNYEPVDDFKFLSLLRDVSLAPVTDKMFKNPVKYREDLERFFGCHEGYRRRGHKSLKIKYCLSCIKDHIKEFGYGYFKVTWPSNDYCPEHNTPLYISTESSRTSGVKALKKIFRGEHPENYSTSNYMSGYFFDDRKYSHIKNVDYFMPCLEDRFKYFILEKRSEFPKSTFDRNYSSEYILTQQYMMARIYGALKKNNVLVFREFWNKYVDTKHINTGVINRLSIKEKVFKDAEKDCQSCKYLYCFAKVE